MPRWSAGVQPAAAVAGIRSIAAPVRSQNGEALAAIDIAVHRSMVSLEDLVARLAPPLKRTAFEISQRADYVICRPNCIPHRNVVLVLS